MIETNTFNSNSIVLSTHNRERDVLVLNRMAVEIARSAVKKSGRDVFIAGSVGPLNISLSLGCKYGFDDVKDCYREQVEALFEGGVDFIIFETSHDIINLKAGIVGVYEIFKTQDLPVVVSVTLDQNGFMLSGNDVSSVYSNLSSFDLIALGINCSGGPATIEPFLKKLSEVSHFPIIVMPNAGFPDEGGRYNLTPHEFSKSILNFAKDGLINIAGGCCGTSPQHILEISKVLKDIKPRDFKKQQIKFSISHKISIFEDEIEKPFLVAERLNTLGSKRFREMIINSENDSIVSLAKEQVLKGAHLLDVSFINPERDEKDDIKKFLPLISSSVRSPIMIDSTDTSSFELALKLTGSKLILNSINFENGEEKALVGVELQKKYGCILIFGLIDEDRKIPFEFERKMEIFKRAVDFFKRNDADLSNIIFDPLVFPIATSPYRGSASDTLRAVEEIKRFGFKTILGISNVSFGLPHNIRKYVNSVFLYLALKRGLDFAIVNILDKIPYALIDDDIKNIIIEILNGNTDLIRDLVERTSKAKRERDDVSNLSDVDLLKNSIIRGYGDIDAIVSGLLSKYEPDYIINNFIIPAMNEVGEKFSRGEYIVTEVLSSASLSQRAIDILKPHIKKESFKRGKLLIATVKGDVHDIGKNLVSIIFESNGFDVVDLGTRVEPDVIVSQVMRESPDFIGLSGLLSRSCEYMVEVALKLREKNINIPLLLGGAALTERFVETRIKPYYPNAFYAKDAVEGVNIALRCQKV